jgi:cytochrome c oxidase subunit IV
MTDTALTDDHATHDSGAIAHVMPLGTLAAVLLALLVLTVITVGAAHYDLGGFSLLVAIGIATIKASLVVLFFMHLRYDNPLYALILVTAFLFLAIFLGAVLLDTIQYQPDIETFRQARPM